MSAREAPFVPSFVAAVGWGAMFPIAAATFSHVDPFQVTSIRYGVASVILLAILVRVEGRQAISFDGRFLRILALGTFGFTAFNLLSYVALEHMPAQNAALIIAASPVVALAIAWISDDVRPTGGQLAGVGAALVGVALVISRGHPSTLLSSLSSGELLVLIGVIGWVYYTRGAAEFAGWSSLRYTSLTASAGLISILGSTAVADAIGYQHLPSAHDVWAVTPQLLYIIFGGAIVAVMAWNIGVRRIGVVNASLFMNLVPITTLAIEVARGYRPTIGELLGVAVTIAALVAVNVAGRRPTAAGAAELEVIEAQLEGASASTAGGFAGASS